MAYFYSAVSGGFFSDMIHSDIPGDAIELTDAQYLALREQIQEGRDVVVEDGEVITVPHVANRTWLTIRRQRNRALTKSDWTQMPDVDLTEEQKAAWAAYRQSLRDLPESFASPGEVEFPVKPE